MSRMAVFVDAGYLLAQGSASLAGEKQSRSVLHLDAESAIKELTKFARTVSGEKELLRIYWYDGADYRGPTLEHTALAHMNHIKMRLGSINKRGQQKGVDSLIVTDLVELARNQAIVDAVLLSGDEDVRIGVDLAQGYGVRVHLLGIEPSRGSQSRQLMQEADTTSEWDKSTISKFLTVKDQNKRISTPKPIVTKDVTVDATLEQVVDEVVGGLTAAEAKELATYWSENKDVPHEFDSKLLGKARDAVGRELSLEERRMMRESFNKKARKNLK